MERKFDHSKNTLGEACGFKEEETTVYRDLLMEQFSKSVESPSKIVEVIEKEIEPRVLAMLLVGSILATKRLESVITMVEMLGGEEAFKKLMRGMSSKEEETETIG